MLESYDISLNATTVVMFYGVGIGAILVSTVVPIIYIMRLDPKKIMM
jgi:putative ABC transport system permease protein